MQGVPVSIYIYIYVDRYRYVEIERVNYRDTYIYI